MILPELPAYLESMGGGEYKGLIIALFTVTAGLSRPFSGKLADRVGRIPVMVVGALVSGIAALIYPFATTIIGFFVLRFFHGFSTGFKPTGTSAYVADVVPAHRRGEAMGYVGFFSGLGTASGHPMGSHIAVNFSLNTMFYASALMAVLSVVILIGMKESLKNTENIKWNHFKIGWKEIYEPRVQAPSFLMFVSVYSFGTVLTVVPDMSDHLGFDNRGLFMGYFLIASLLVRIFAGKASDRFGRVPVLRVGCIIVFLALLMIAHVDSQLSFTISAFVFGFGVGICSPTVFAWTVDLSSEKHMGRGVATMYIALEVGIMMGSLVTGWVYANTIENIPQVFYISAGSVLIGFIYLYSKTVQRLNVKPQIHG